MSKKQSKRAREKAWWKKRQEKKYLDGEKAITQYHKDLATELEVVKIEIEDVISSFYARYMKENGISNYAEAQKLLDKTELKGLEYFLNRVNEKMGEYDLELNNLSLKARLTRYQALEMKIDALLQQVYSIEYEQKGIEELKKLYEETYYQSIYNSDIASGIHTGLTSIDTGAIDEIIRYPFNGANFSSRLWKQKDHLQQQLTEALMNMIVKGSNPNVLSKDFAKKFGTKQQEAYRLLHTEASYVMEQATQKAYTDDEVEEYQWLATLDTKTCDICGPLDGKIFKVGKGFVGTNLPPAHAWCRCTTVPYYEDDLQEDETRVGRDTEDNEIEVPDDMNYSEWYKKYVKSNHAGAVNEKTG